MLRMKVLYILTGPPGSGKSTYARQLIVDGVANEIFDHDLGNKKEWCTYPGSCVLCTAAPSSSTKDYWIMEARKYGFVPELFTMWKPRMTALEHMTARNGLSPDQRNDLNSGVEAWYKAYTRNPHEQRISHGQRD